MSLSWCGGPVLFCNVRYDGQALRTPHAVLRLGAYIASGSGAVVHAVQVTEAPESTPPGCYECPGWPARLRKGAAAALKICNPIPFPPALQGNALSRCWLLHRGAPLESDTSGTAVNFTAEHVWWLWDPITLATVAAFLPASAATLAAAGPQGPCEPQPPQPASTGLREITLPQAMQAWGVNPPQARLAEGAPLLPRGAPPHPPAAAAAGAGSASNVSRIVSVRGRPVTVPVIPDRYLRFLSAYAVACREVGVHARVGASGGQQQEQERQPGGPNSDWPPHILRLEAVLEQVRDYECILMLLMERADRGDLFSFIQTHAASYAPPSEQQGQQHGATAASSTTAGASNRPPGASRLGNAAAPPPWDSPDAEVRGQWVARGILGGLQAVHAAGVAHRDVKPENVLLVTSSPAAAPADEQQQQRQPQPPGLEVRLSDFGLAALLATQEAALIVPPATADAVTGATAAAAPLPEAGAEPPASASFFRGGSHSRSCPPPSSLVLAGIAGRMVLAPTEAEQQAVGLQGEVQEEAEEQAETCSQDYDSIPVLEWELSCTGGSAAQAASATSGGLPPGTAASAASGALSPAFFRASLPRRAGLPPVSPARPSPSSGGAGAELGPFLASPTGQPSRMPGLLASPLGSPGVVPDSPALRGMAPAFANVRREEGAGQGAPPTSGGGVASSGGTVSSSGGLTGRRRLTSSSSAASLASMCLSPRPSPPGSPSLSALFTGRRLGGGPPAAAASPLGPRPATPVSSSTPTLAALTSSSCPASPALGPATFSIIPPGTASPQLQPLPAAAPHLHSPLHPVFTLSSSSSSAAAAAGAATEPGPYPAAPQPESEGGPLSRVKSIVGSPLYAAPELIALSAARVAGSATLQQYHQHQLQTQQQDRAGAVPADGYDPRLADAWSVGVVLYALLTGSLPFQERLLQCPRFQRWCSWIKAREERAAAVRGALQSYDEALTLHEAATSAWTQRAAAAAASAAASAAAAAAALACGPGRDGSHPGNAGSASASSCHSSSRARQRGRRHAAGEGSGGQAKQGRGGKRRGSDGIKGDALASSALSSPSSHSASSRENSPGFDEHGRHQHGRRGSNCEPPPQLQEGNAGRRGLWPRRSQSPGASGQPRSQSPNSDAQAAARVQQLLWGGGETPMLPLPNALHCREAQASEVECDPNADAHDDRQPAHGAQPGLSPPRQGGGLRAGRQPRQPGQQAQQGQQPPANQATAAAVAAASPKEATPKRGSGGGAGGGGSSLAVRRSATAPLPAYSPDPAGHWVVGDYGEGEEGSVPRGAEAGGEEEVGEDGVVLLTSPDPNAALSLSTVFDLEEVGHPPPPPLPPALPAAVAYPSWFFCGPELSVAAKELLSGLLHPDPTRRLTVSEALSHPWTQGLLGPSPAAATAAAQAGEEPPTAALPWWVTNPQPEALTADMVMTWRAAHRHQPPAPQEEQGEGLECEGQGQDPLPPAEAPPSASGGGAGSSDFDDDFTLGPASLSVDDDGSSGAHGSGSGPSSGWQRSPGRRPSTLSLGYGSEMTVVSAGTSPGTAGGKGAKPGASGSNPSSTMSSPVLGFLSSAVLRAKAGTSAASPFFGAGGKALAGDAVLPPLAPGAGGGAGTSGGAVTASVRPAPPSPYLLASALGITGIKLPSAVPTPHPESESEEDSARLTL